MDSNELLNRLKDRDMGAYHLLTEHYGWKLYSYLKTRFKDKEQVDAAFNESLHQFYSTIAGSEDAVEALLFSFADRICENMKHNQNITVPEQKSSGKMGTVLFTVAFSILLLGIFVTLWVIIGILMDLGIMPELDLGYSWFSDHVFPWF